VNHGLANRKPGLRSPLDAAHSLGFQLQLLVDSKCWQISWPKEASYSRDRTSRRNKTAGAPSRSSFTRLLESTRKIRVIAASPVRTPKFIQHSSNSSKYCWFKTLKSAVLNSRWPAVRNGDLPLCRHWAIEPLSHWVTYSDDESCHWAFKVPKMTIMKHCKSTLRQQHTRGSSPSLWPTISLTKTHRRFLKQFHGAESLLKSCLLLS
jgi:hypothetical protein